MGGEGAADMLGLLAFFRVGGGGVWLVRSGSNFFFVEYRYVRWLGKVLGGGWMEPERLILRSLAGKSRGWLVRGFGLCLPKFSKRCDF